LAATLQQVALLRNILTCQDVAQQCDLLQTCCSCCATRAICCATHAICCGFVAQQAAQQVAQQIAQVEFDYNCNIFKILFRMFLSRYWVL